MNVNYIQNAVFLLIHTKHYHRFNQISKSCAKCAFHTDIFDYTDKFCLLYMLALCLMLLSSYYAQYYADIIGSSLLPDHFLIHVLNG